MPLIINDMIQDSSGRKKDILLELRKLNKTMFMMMRTFNRNYKEKYRSVQKTQEWKRAKELNLEYVLIDNILICSYCNQVIDYRLAVMHHTKYNDEEITTPAFIQFLHYNCHARLHKKKPRKDFFH